MIIESDPDGHEDDFDIDDDAFIDDDISEDTIVLVDPERSANIGDVSVEINVEELVAQVEAEQSCDAARKAEIRRRLEEIYETKDIEDTYAIEFGED